MQETPPRLAWRLKQSPFLPARKCGFFLFSLSINSVGKLL
ncbi:hypothetical protein HMPREF0004_1730 [Achromobacter piechaudii ATCC 43553]|uniref:Uncharacterized protein n=1 Tax=Achromobacter piechaudii ATCC 43553 TaxID=742159 RepID=D4X883_9BURK|nr:hypothetical protein HMPREF0004_1730 [Achromobacter piechaudii ATCC 43553]